MRCEYCGNIIPDHLLQCEKCGHLVQMVPDYNPLDDMLSEHIKDSINGNESGKITVTQDGRNSRTRSSSSKTQNTKKQQTATGAQKARTSQTNRNTQTGARRTAQNRGTLSEKEKRRRMIARKKALRRKRRRLVLTIFLILILVITGVSFGLYQISYSGLISRGEKALNTGDYTTAAELFNKAIDKNDKKAEAYIGLADIALAQENKDDAEKVYLDVISEQPENTDLYDACIQYYLKVEQQEKIPDLLASASDSVRSSLNKYDIVKPSFSLEDNTTYDEVQQLSLTADEGDKIYYTTDGKEPTVNSKEYTEPLLLEEGETTIKAISVDDETEIPSAVASKTYTVELPIEDAPAVSPSTGQYTTETQIEIIVPDGYTAYYTIDESDPTTSSAKYTDPIDMPEGETIFKAILVNKAGRVSGITTRNYVLDLD